jgi:hypothetical protein
MAVLKILNTRLTGLVALVAAVSVVSITPILAQNATPGSTFKRVKVGDSPSGAFKRVKVGDRQSGDLINIQIQEIERQAQEAEQEASQEGTSTSVAKTDPSKPKADLQDWFWSGVSPALKDADGKKLEKALSQMDKAPSYFSPNIQHIRKLAGMFGRDILVGSLGTDVSPAFLLAIISVESAGKIDAVSSAGAQGLMQLIPATAERFGVTDVNDPIQNIKGGATYMSWLLKNFDDDPILALAGYNAGENAVKGNGGVPLYAETRAYVPKVVAAWQVAKTLCQSPPTYVWQGCVFTVPPIPRAEKTAEIKTTDTKE